MKKLPYYEIIIKLPILSILSFIIILLSLITVIWDFNFALGCFPFDAKP